MSLPHTPRVVYGTPATDFAFSLPAAMWTPKLHTLGGAELDAPIPASYELRTDYILPVVLRFYESEWPDVLAWLYFALTMEAFSFRTDDDGSAVDCYLVKPAFGDDIQPQRNDFAPVYELAVELRRVDGAEWTPEWFGAEDT